MQVIVDGWGRVIKEAEQMEYLKKLEFIPFKVSLFSWRLPKPVEVLSTPVLGNKALLLHGLLAMSESCCCVRAEPCEFGRSTGHLPAHCIELLQRSWDACRGIPCL